MADKDVVLPPIAPDTTCIEAIDVIPTNCSEKDRLLKINNIDLLKINATDFLIINRIEWEEVERVCGDCTNK